METGWSKILESLVAAIVMLIPIGFGVIYAYLNKLKKKIEENTDITKEVHDTVTETK